MKIYNYIMILGFLLWGTTFSRAEYLFANEFADVQRNMNYSIESVSPLGYQVQIRNEYPNGLAVGSFDVLFSVNYPDQDRFELIDFQYEGSGNCQMIDEQDWQCTGEITYLKQEWRYLFDVSFAGQNFVVPVRAFETDGADFALTLTYPSPVEYLSATNTPTATQSNTLSWSIANMTSFETVLTFRDPRINSIYLPIVNRR